jgi:DNA-binding MarR family transcriptional regulator
MHAHLMTKQLMSSHKILMHDNVASVSRPEEGTLVAQWQELLGRYAAVWHPLERELQRRHAIGVSEFEALERLATCAHDKCRAAELADAARLSQSAASRLAARLERAGLVEREMCDLDRRGIFLTLTEAGHRRYTQAKPTHRAVLAEVLAE